MTELGDAKKGGIRFRSKHRFGYSPNFAHRLVEWAATNHQVYDQTETRRSDITRLMHPCRSCFI